MATQEALAFLDSHRDGRTWVIRRCPFCRKRHLHGGGGLEDDPRTFLGPQRAHCLDDGRYELVEADRGHTDAILSQR